MEVLLVAEVVVEQPARDAGLLGEQVDRQLVQRAGGEQPDAQLEQLLARSSGLSRVRDHVVTVTDVNTLLTVVQ